MSIDVNKVLQVEYLNGLVLQLNNNLKNINDSIVELFDLDKITNMSIDDIKSLFDEYKVSCDNIIEYVDLVFWDDDWAYADLYAEDREHVKNLENKLKEDSLVEIDRLNEKINVLNDKNKLMISKLKSELELVNAVLKILINDGFVLEDDVDNLKLLISNCDLSDMDKFTFSSLIVRYLIENDIRIKKVADVKEKQQNIDLETKEFEKKLDSAYGSSQYKNPDKDIDLSNSIYGEKIRDFYNQYSGLFNSVGLGETIGQVMGTASSMVDELNDFGDSVSKEDFCIRFGAFLHDLYVFGDEEIIFSLGSLDMFYREDFQLSSYKQVLIDEINNSLLMVDKLNIKCLFRDTIIGKLKALNLELKNNLINTKRKEEIALELISLKCSINDLSERVSFVNDLTKLEDEVNKMISLGIDVSDEYYTGLSSLQSEISEIKEEIKENGINVNISNKIKSIHVNIAKYKEDLKNAKKKNEHSETNKKINLKGFVLFDFDKNNQPYVIDDLNPINDDMIDKSIEFGDLISGFADYSNLINDLLIYGTPSIMKDEIPVFIAKILDKVYYDPDSRKHPTGMVRIRPLRNSVVRFIEQRVILKSDTEIHKQVCGIIKEILPDTDISLTDDFFIYINYASALKKDDKDSYSMAINRFDGGSVLRQLFDSPKDRLNDSEYEILRDIVKMSVDAYDKLEKINPNLKFDVIKEIGGKKTRG